MPGMPGPGYPFYYQGLVPSPMYSQYGLPISPLMAVPYSSPVASAMPMKDHNAARGPKPGQPIVPQQEIYPPNGMSPSPTDMLGYEHGANNANWEANMIGLISTLQN